MDQSTPDLLHEYENELHLIPVSAGVRFLNYLIDLAVFYAMMMVYGAIWGLSLASEGLDAYDTRQAVENAVVMQYLISFGAMIGYYIVFEGASQGRTLGKLITGTVVVKDDGSPITFKDALLRTLCRFIPFEPFSAFGGRPWHDTITRTMVIKKPR
jgi:uncharacterized RDD family membrane protein YckC